MIRIGLHRGPWTNSVLRQRICLMCDTCSACSYIESFLTVRPTFLDQVECHSSSTENFQDHEDPPVADGCRPLHVACGHGRVDIVNYLLANNANANVKTVGKSLTPLQLAVHKYEVSSELCAALVQAGADLDVSDNNGTPLHIAITHYSSDVFRSLLSAYHLYPDKVSRALCTFDHNGDLPLHTALHARSARITQMLVDAGVDVNAASQRGIVPLLLSVDYDDSDSTRVLLNTKAVTAHLNVALDRATRHGNNEMISLLIDAGADPNQGELSPLMTAVFLGRSDIMQLLIDKGAQAGAPDDRATVDGNTPLALACHGGHFDVVEVFVNRNCNVNNLDRDCDSPLIYASYNGDLASVKLLLRHGANASIQNRVNATPVWNASYGGHLDVLLVLISVGNPPLSVASVGMDQHSGGARAQLIYHTERTPLYVALDRGHKCIADALLKSGVDMRDEMWYWNDDKPQGLDQIWSDRLNEAAHNVAPLMDCVRRFTRGLLGSKVLTVVPKLDLPTTLKDYLLLK